MNVKRSKRWKILTNGDRRSLKGSKRWRHQCHNHNISSLLLCDHSLQTCVFANEVQYYERDKYWLEKEKHVMVHCIEFFPVSVRTPRNSTILKMWKSFIFSVYPIRSCLLLNHSLEHETKGEIEVNKFDCPRNAKIVLYYSFNSCTIQYIKFDYPFHSVPKSFDSKQKTVPQSCHGNYKSLHFATNLECNIGENLRKYTLMLRQVRIQISCT